MYRNRDSVTQLAMVPPEAMDSGARNAFRRLLRLHKPSVGPLVVPVIFYYSPIVKRTRRGRSVSRYLLVSRTHWYICKPNGGISRCSRVDSVEKILVCLSLHVVWKVSQARDVVMRFEDAGEVGFLTNVLRILRASVAGRPPLEVINSDLDYTQLRGPDKVQLEGKTRNDREWPLPVVLVDEAYRQHSEEEVMMTMMMPPPPSSLSPFLTLPRDAKSVLVPASAETRDADSGDNRESRISAILCFMDGKADMSPPPDPPVAPPPPSSSSSPGFQKVEPKELTPCEKAVLPMASASSSTIRHIREVGNVTDVTVVVPATKQPLESSPHSSHMTASIAPVTEAVRPRPPPPPPLSVMGMGGIRSSSGDMIMSKNTVEVRSLLRELCDVEARVASLERLKGEGLKQQHSHDGSSETPAQRSAVKANTTSLGGNTPGSLPASPFLSFSPPPRISTRPDEPLGMVAAEFERRIRTKTVSERLVLREHEIDEKLRQASACIKGGDVRQLLLVAHLQEDVLPLLLEAQRVDEEEQKKQQESCLTNERSVYTGISRGGNSGMRSDDDKSEVEEEEEEEGVSELRDYNVWASTNAGKRWYNEHFGEHLSACKVKMVQNAFEHGDLWL